MAYSIETDEGTVYIDEAYYQQLVAETKKEIKQLRYERAAKRVAKVLLGVAILAALVGLALAMISWPR